MKLEFIRISELFGEPAYQKKIDVLAAELSGIDAISAEVKRANEKKNISKRAESLAGLYLLSRAAELSGMRVERTAKNRPYISDLSFDFNISHSEDLAVIAVDCFRVGIDTEKIRTVFDRDRLASRYFCEAETEYICQASDKDEAFFRIWTRKEAYLKFTGDGFFGDIRSINTLSGDISFVEKILIFGADRYIISAVVASEDK